MPPRALRKPRPVAAPDEAGVARGLLEALSAPDPDAAVELMHPEVEIVTAKGTLTGRDAAREWADKQFDHLHRRYVPLGASNDGDEVVVPTRLEYVWRSSGEVGDASEVTVRLLMQDGLVKRWRID